ncbi:MAG: flippase [Calditrichaeota bacterium]|nr:MAG: flippase [Calditrichota bacterium]
MLKLQRNALRIFSNAVSILASDVMNRISAFITYVLVARFLGSLEFGQMALAFTFFQTFQMLAVAGLQSFITREVAKDHDKTEFFLINASVVVSATSLAAILFLIVFVWIMQYSFQTSSTIILLSLGLLPFSLASVCDALFQAREQMHYITYSNFFVNVFRISGVFILLWWKNSLQLLIVFFILTYFINFLIKLWFLLRQMTPTGAKFDREQCFVMAKSSTTFLGINGVNAATSSFNIILLSKFTNEVQVGILSAANQLLSPISLLFESVVVGVYPVMCRSFESGMGKLKQMTKRVWEILLAIVLPATITLFFLSDALFVTIYGNEDFSQSAAVLKIIVWILILRASSKVLGVALIASFKEKKTLQILVVDLIAMVFLGFILVSQYGVIGSAFTMLSVRIIDFIQHYVPVSRMFKNLEVREVSWKSLCAVFFMALLLIFLQDINVIIAAISANLFYLATLFALLYISIGNLDQIKLRYLTLNSK